MKSFLRVILGVILTYLIVIEFGWIGLLVSLPLLFAASFIAYWAMEKWKRRNSIR